MRIDPAYHTAGWFYTGTTASNNALYYPTTVLPVFPQAPSVAPAPQVEDPVGWLRSKVQDVCDLAVPA